LELRSVPERLLVVGGGYVGLELGFAYAGLGSKVTVVEVLPQLLTGADPDLVQPVRRSCRKRFEAVLLNTRVTGMSQNNGRFMVTLENKDDPAREAEFDQVLVAVGRTPNTTDIGLEGLGIQTDRLGLIPVSEEMRTRVPHIFAIGDAVPGPGLAHKASREGKVAAEVINKQPAAFDNVSVPAVVFTEPEVAWAGLTEQRATNEGYKIKVGKFSLSALGRAKSVGRTDGLAKVIASAETGAIVGVGLVGPHASELIGEAVLALEMGAVLEDITTTIHPHPTFSEALLEAAEMAQGTSVHVAPSRRI